ncbi:MAG: aminotransferase class IV [Verrucomicrobia bacterium]|nr:aminotransferase class IV [Verrucomicrobiota bacterium]MDE3098610.1 aminotransferase class IV [Verrucomicrobiota bacterium]
MPEKEAVVSIFDRGFLYGDGLFETIRVVDGRPFRWAAHLARLQGGADFLKISWPGFLNGGAANSIRSGRPVGQAGCGIHEQLLRAAGALIARNKTRDGVLRLNLTRGIGPRGYSPAGATQPTLAMTLHPMPETIGNPPGWSLMTSSLRLPLNDPLSRFKTANKLAQIAARMEADAAGADEALLANTNGFAAEAAAANLFWVEDGRVFTPPTAAGILPGITRALVFEIGSRLEIPVRERNIRPGDLARMDGVFLSLTSLGIVEARALDGKRLKRSPLTRRIAEWLHEERGNGARDGAGTDRYASEQNVARRMADMAK